MKNPICISISCVDKLSDDRNKFVEKLRQLSPKGVELSFAYPDDLFDFDINKNNLEYLRSLKFNSIHAPWKNIIYGKNKTSEKVLQKISELYKQIKCRNVVFHKNEIEDYSVITNNGFTASIENDDWRKPNNNFEDMKDILDSRREFKLTFDFSHALSVSFPDNLRYINYFKDRLIEIHLSIINKNSEKHDFLHKYNTSELKALLQPLKTVFVPIILEGAVSNLEEIRSIKKEMEYIGTL